MGQDKIVLLYAHHNTRTTPALDPELRSEAPDIPSTCSTLPKDRGYSTR